MNAGKEVNNVVLVHGGFVDGSGWQGVYDHLTADGYRVAVVQNPTLSLADDVQVTRRVLDGLDGPAVLVGHSYGGVVITEAGLHDKVAGLAYIAAFAPDKGESVNSLIADPPPGAPVPPILPPQDGFHPPLPGLPQARHHLTRRPARGTRRYAPRVSRAQSRVRPRGGQRTR